MNRAGFVLAALLLFSMPAAFAQESGAASYFTDVRLIDHEGREHRLYSDLLQGKVVVISAMFTECGGACPVMAASLAQVQTWAGDRLGKDVLLLSFTVDRENDSPAELKKFAERFEAKPGWYFLTGSKENLETALRKLGLYTENREAHATLFTIGNEKTGLWKKALGIAKPSELVQIVETVANDKG